MFMLVSRRYERVSLIVTFNKPFSVWGQIFGDDVGTAAMIDRLIHRRDPPLNATATASGARDRAPTGRRDRRNRLTDPRSRLQPRRPADTAPIVPARRR